MINCRTADPVSFVSNLLNRALRTSRAATAVARSLGLPWLVRRVVYSASLRVGVFRKRLPATSWDEAPFTKLFADPALAEPGALVAHRLSLRDRFFVQTDEAARSRETLRAFDVSSECVDAAEKIVEGVWTWFSGVEVAVGADPAWTTNPFTGRSIPATAHWSSISDFGSGDIKMVWEPSRFGMAYTLVRAYWRTGDDRYAECFWSLVESWRGANPPQMGPNWKCGQETTFRLMAWSFGLQGFLQSPATTPERVVMLVQMIGVSGRRIAANVDYALQQQNNHGVSEGTGLLTLGLLYPELAESSRWRVLGRQILEREARELIYDDGAFSQHSLNYQRLMLHDYAWSARLAALAGEPMSEALLSRIARSARLLWQLQDASTGAVPSYGANDGSLILPLTNCRYDDFRPVVQAIAVLTSGHRRFEPGPWDEEAFWLCGPSALKAPLDTEERGALEAPIGGYFVQRDEESHVFVRAVERFQHRPGHADLLHVDLTWRGVNIAMDAGTCSYNDPALPDASFDRTRFHNTVVVDAVDQMERASRFLWAPWPLGGAGAPLVALPASTSYWEGWHAGYARLADPVTHRRAVVGLGCGVWVVADQLDAAGPHDARLHWMFPDIPHAESGASVVFKTPVGFYAASAWSDGEHPQPTMIRGGDNLVGWHSRRYGTREPALAFQLERRSAVRPRFVTVFAPAPVEFVTRPDGVAFAVGEEAVTLQFSTAPTHPMLRILRTMSTY
jgi:hypothetical protein